MGKRVVCMIVSNNVTEAMATLVHAMPFVDSWLIADVRTEPGSLPALVSFMHHLPGKLLHVDQCDINDVAALALKDPNVDMALLMMPGQPSNEWRWRLRQPASSDDPKSQTHQE